VGLRNEWGLTLVAAHLNHGFRGAEADADADYVTDLCRALDVPCISERIDVPALQRRRRLSAQAAAREARHAFLRRAAAEHSADRIALGHNRDDRIETILLNLLRGTGLEGLAGFPPIDSTAADSPVVPATPVVTRIARPLLVRPLYDAGRAQIEAYCRSRLQETGDRRKSIQFLQGKCSFRTIPGALRITDSAAALAYAQECLPAAVTTVPTLDTAAYQQRAERTGELLPGLEFTPEHTSFALTFGKQTGD